MPRGLHGFMYMRAQPPVIRTSLLQATVAGQLNQPSQAPMHLTCFLQGQQPCVDGALQFCVVQPARIGERYIKLHDRGSLEAGERPLFSTCCVRAGPATRSCTISSAATSLERLSEHSRWWGCAAASTAQGSRDQRPQPRSSHMTPHSPETALASTAPGPPRSARCKKGGGGPSMACGTTRLPAPATTLEITANGAAHTSRFSAGQVCNLPGSRPQPDPLTCACLERIQHGDFVSNVVPREVLDLRLPHVWHPATQGLRWP